MKCTKDLIKDFLDMKKLKDELMSLNKIKDNQLREKNREIENQKELLIETAKSEHKCERLHLWYKIHREMEMTLNGADKIIAEYMGFKYNNVNNSIDMWHRNNGWQHFDLYTNSLDALVPVWRKLQIIPFERDGCVVCSYTDGSNQTIQESAAIATAKAIKELNE